MLVWLNGPGLRWLAPKVAGHFLEKAGIHGKFTLEGSLTGGISVKDVRFASDKTLAGLSVGRAAVSYELGELVRGRVRGIAIDDLHVDLRLGVTDEKPDAGEKPPLDLAKLVETLRMVRGRFIPLAVDLRNISLNATKDGKPVVALAPSRILHGAGESVLKLEIGAITDANHREWPAQKSTIQWNADDLLLDRVDPLPGVSVRNLVLRLPERGGPSAECGIWLDDAVFMVAVAPGFSSLTLDLREGSLRSEAISERLGLKLPARATLTSLSVNVDGILPDPGGAAGAVRLLLEDVVSGEWKVPELSLDLALETDHSTVAASGRALGTGFSLHASAPIARDGGVFKAGDVRGDFNVAEVAKLVAALSERVKAIDPECPVPPSMVDGKFSIAMKDNRPGAADVDLVLKPADPKVVSAVAVKGRWQAAQPVAVGIEIDGLEVEADYRPDSSTYDALAELEKFNSVRIDRWLAIVKAKIGGAVALTGKWSGGGDVKSGKHHGSLLLGGAEFSREGAPAIKATGELTYDWPAGFATKDLRLQANDQSVSVDASLADGMLDLSNLSWLNAKTEIAGGFARLPVPEDFSKWRDTLARDVRPLEVVVESKVLSLALLKDWLPAAAKLAPRSTGRLQVKIAGTYAEPSVDVVLEAKDLRSPEQPKLPPADLKLTFVGKSGRLVVDGSATAPDFPAALMTASMPFRPAEWAEKPALIASEKISARVDLPRVDLARFASLVPSLRKVAGIVTGNVEVAGEVGKPVIKGNIDLTGGGFELKGEQIPAVTGVGASVDLALDRIVLKDLKATVAGGTLKGGGSLAIANGKPGALDFRLAGNHLPLIRDDSLIVRVNTDLRLSGTWERAALTGTVGVVDSLFYRDIELLPIGTPFTAPSAAALPKIDAPASRSPSMPEPFRNWTLKVLARTENPFLIRGNFATGRVEANLRVGGTFGSPAPDGDVKISDFRAALPFSTLTVKSGFVRFRPATGFDPVLEIRGNAEPRPYRISVFVYGRASNPQLVLTSNPPLPDNEIMTLLATGTTTSGLENPQAASSRAMQLLAEELRRGRFAVGKQLRPVLGLLDRVDFSLAEADPYSSDSFSTATINITDRWFLSAGMGAEGDSRVMGIWRIMFH